MSDPKDYTVGWICAISTEYVAAQAFLDEKHDGPDHVAAADNNDYTLGRMGKHNVVIAVLPDGEYGISSAAIVAKDMLHTFTNIRIGLMVGIGGGAPTPKNDIRLGDIVVSTPRHGQSGVFQYDFGKTIQDRYFQTTGFLNQPPAVLRTAVSGLRSSHELEGHQIKEAIDSVLEKRPRLRKNYVRPPRGHDVLYQSTMVHQNDYKDCLNGCGQDPRSLVLRPERTEDEDDIVIHYGQIASANQLMKDALVRDQISNEHDVLCFEMESGGLMNNFPCLVIRGICDYADSHKNKEWQGYAAMVAAAYSKDLLCRIAPTRIEAEVQVIDMLSDVQRDVGELLQAQQNGEYEAILQWLTPIEYISQQNDNYNRRQPGTNQWFLESNEFQFWLETRGHTLFCQGMPGAGKTLLSAAVVRYLQNERWNTMQIGVAYIYYNFRRQHEQNPTDVFASLLKQLGHGLDPFPTILKELYEEHRPQETRPSFDEIFLALQTVLHCYTKTFIIIDALDECSASNQVRQQFLEQIFRLQEASGTNLLATSRFSLDVEKSFQGDRILRLVIQASQDDLQKYLNGNLRILPSFVSRSEELQRQVKNTIVEAVDGMFLLAQLHLASLVGKRSPKALVTALNQLSTGSDAYYHAYDECMVRIRGQAPDLSVLAMQALSWITFAKRPLTTTELRHALGVEIGKAKFDERNLSDIEDIQSASAGLVTIDDESSIIRLVHYTTQQYLEQTQDTWFPDAHNDISNTLLTYLTFDIFKTGTCSNQKAYASRLKTNPLYEYAAKNWGHHVCVSLNETMQSVLSFFRNESALSASCQVLMSDSYWVQHYSLPTGMGMTPMHLAAWFGLAAIMKQMLDAQVSPNPKNQDQETPLFLAVRHAKDDIVKLLVSRRDVDVNSRNEYNKTPLSHAAEHGYSNMVQLLMTRSDLKVNARGYDGLTPLSLAIQAASEATVKLLLTHPDIDLDWAASNNYPDHLYFAFSWGLTPLDMAIRAHDASMIRILLAHTDVISQAANKALSGALSTAVQLKHIPVIKELLKRHDLDPNVPDEEGRTSLIWAALEQETEIVNMLLAHPRISIDSEQPLFVHHYTTNGDRDDRLVFAMYAAESGHMKALAFVLDRHPDVLHCKDKSGKTPLHLAAMYNHVAAVKLLIEQARVDVNVSDDEHGRTPLSWAAGAGHLLVVQALLSSGGTDPNAADVQRRTPLAWAAKKGSLDIVKILLDCANIDVNLEGILGQAPLSHAAEEGHEEVVEALLAHSDIDSSVNIKETADGLTPLSFAARYGHIEVVKVLLTSKSVDLDNRSHSGITPLIWAAGAGHWEVVQLLLQRGAKLDQLDNSGWTALTWAENNHFPKVVELLRSCPMQNDQTVSGY
ncbi:hypothetical protein LTR84_012699 [Exophiala bonariae]|uniref:NACHT domain-containing protein n=1 Tax=Exophiala bonariae TaxID=1690606 RepID=A0AAV9NEX5_9EURO|nr:hypothetical protein LTR84_012699 [Exophiala bonariae]